MAQITKLFTKGLDTDTAPHLQEKESYSSAMNVHFSLGSLFGPSDGQGGGMATYNTGGDAGVLEPFAGNTDWTSLFTTMPGLNPFTSARNYVRGYDKNGAKCIGYATDDTESLSSNTRFIYLFISTPQYGSPIEFANSYIIKVALQYDNFLGGTKSTIINPSQSSVLLNGEWVDNAGQDELGFLATDFISARVSGSQLIFTDGRNPVRYVDVTKDYFTNRPTSEDLTLITEPGHVPLTSFRGSDITKPLILQKQNFQFTYRITNDDNFISVLAPYSSTSLSARAEEIAAVSYTSNIITIDLLKTQIIPNNWKKVEIVAINLETQAYQVIRVFDKYDLTVRYYSLNSGVNLTDAELIAQHNDPAYTGIHITYENWDGTNIQYSLSTTESYKQFDSLPITSKALELASNRLFLANNLEGYTTPATAPNIPADVTTGLYTAPTSNLAAMGTAGYAISSFNIINGGSGHGVGDILTISAPPAGGLTANAHVSAVDGSGAITAIQLDFGGCGYVSPPSVTIPGGSPAANITANLSSLLSSGNQAYLVTIRNQGVTTGNWFSCIVSRDYSTGTNYGWPVDCGNINFTKGGAATIPVGTYNSDLAFINLPKYISKKSLIKLNETTDPRLYFVSPNAIPSGSARTDVRNARLNILKELNTYATGVTLGVDDNCEESFKIDYSNSTIAILENADYKTSTNKQRAFYPNSSYEYGIQYYDSALRKSGVKKIGTFNVPIFNPVNKQLLEYVVFDTTVTQTSGIIPNWAKYYSICVAKNTKASNFVSFVPDMMRFAYKNTDGTLVYDQVETSTKYEYYGLAIPLSELYKDGLGYSYTAGDLCDLNIKDNLGNPVNLTYSVLSVIDGYVIIGADKSTISQYISLQTNQFTLTSINTFLYAPLRTQKEMFATLYTPVLSQPSEYEVAIIGEVTSSTTLGAPFIFTYLNGDTYTQSRDGEGGSQMMLSKARYEINQINWIHDFGRIAPVDNIGQRQLTNSIRWSNVKLPNSNVNGLSTFDALDETSVDQSAGPITTIYLSSKEANQGGRLLVLCNSGSFIALVGQQQIYSADQTPALTSSAGVLGTILPLTNMWGCISPQSVVGYKGIVFWADALNREIIQFAGDGASPISQQKAGFLWNQVFRNLPFDNSANSAVNIKCGINPYTYELFITCPNPGISNKVYPGNCGPNRINQYVGDKNVSYVYNWQSNTWVGAYEDNPDQWIRIGDDVYSIGSQYGTEGLQIYKEFDNTTGVFNQATTGAWIAAPYSIGTYPSTIEPLSIILMGQLTTNSTIVYARDNSTNVSDDLTQITKISNDNYSMREGEMFSSVYRNRLSNNAIEPAQWDTQNLIGDRIRTKTPWVQLNFPTNQQINLQGIRLEVKQSSGH